MASSTDAPLVRRTPAGTDLPPGPALLARLPGLRWWSRAGRGMVDLVGGGLTGLGLAPRDLDPELVVWLARKRTGLTELGVVDHPEGLAVACASLSREAGLGAFGRLVVGNALVMGVANRLRYVDAQARVPQRFDVPLLPPIFVVGLPRSGTTFLHRLLCSVPGTRGIPMWESRQPIAGRVDRRRQSTAWELAALRGTVPEVMAKHAFELDSPEEAITLFEASLGWNPFLWRIAGCHSYVDWLLRQDASGPYAAFVDLLHWIGAPTPDHRMVLKTPNHLGYIDTLHELLPQAIFVRTYRSPAKCVPSYASLAATMHEVSAGSVDKVAIGRTSLRLWGIHAARAARARAPVIEVPYDRLVADPVGMVRHVYDEAGLRWSPEVQRAVSSEVKQRPAGRHGKHVYAAEDFGLTEDLICRRYERMVREGVPG